MRLSLLLSLLVVSLTCLANEPTYCERTTVTQCNHSRGQSASAGSESATFYKLVVFVRFFVGGPLVVSGFASLKTCEEAGVKVRADFSADAIVWSSCVKTDLP